MSTSLRGTLALLAALVTVGIAGFGAGNAVAAAKKRAKKRTNRNILRAVRELGSVG